MLQLAQLRCRAARTTVRNGRLASAAAEVVVPAVALAAVGKEEFVKGLWQRRRECQFGTAAAAAAASESVHAHTADTPGYIDTADGTVPAAAPAQGYKREKFGEWKRERCRGRKQIACREGGNGQEEWQERKE